MFQDASAPILATIMACIAGSTADRPRDELRPIPFEVDTGMCLLDKAVLAGAAIFGVQRAASWAGLVCVSLPQGIAEAAAANSQRGIEHAHFRGGSIVKAKLISRITVVSLFLSSVAISGLALAQTQPTPVPDHPNVNEVNQRQANQQNRIQNGVADGQINAKQEARDEQHASNISARESHDEAEHGGHLTKGETHRLNRAQNRNSRQIHRQRTHG